MQFTVATYLNDGPGRFWEYEAGDRLVPGPALTLDGDREDAVLEEAFFVGNRQGPDANGDRWPATVRSLSTGDVCVIGEVAWTVDHIGFKIIPTDALAWSLDPDRAVTSDRGSLL